MRKDDTHYCIECGSTLPWRYKGRQRIYCSQMCRKLYTEKKKETKKDAPASTGDVGAANFVYSDVAEAKKNEDWFENKPSKKDQKKLGKKYMDWYKEEITDQQ